MIFEVQVQALYYPEVEQLIKRVAGATRVHIFDHTIRRGRAAGYCAAHAINGYMNLCRECLLKSEVYEFVLCALPCLYECQR